MIAFLSAISLRRFRGFEEAIIKKELPKIEIPEIKLPEFDLDKLDLRDFDLKHWRRGPIVEQPPEENYQTFVSSDKTIKMKYPADWQEIDKVFLEKINQKMKELKLEEETKILFFAYQVKRLVEHPPILVVLSMSAEKGLEEIIEEIKRIAKEKQMEMEIVKTEIKNEKVYFEVKYMEKPHIFDLKGKIIFTEKKNYLITILALEETLKGITPQVDFILNSVQVAQ